MTSFGVAAVPMTSCNPAGLAADLLLGGVTGAVGTAAQTSNRPYHNPSRTVPAELGETLRHSTVHSILTPSRLGLAKFTVGMYERSQLWKYAEEAAAESYGTLSIPKGLTFPFTSGGYGLNPLRVGAEALGVGGVGFDGCKLLEGAFGDD
jgi:hypothetical protein